MDHCRLTKECLQAVANALDKYITDCYNAVSHIINRKEQDYRNEGNDDLRAGRYNAQSVQDWYDNKCRKLRNWSDECAENIQDTSKILSNLFEIMCNDEYSDLDLGYRFIYDFQTGKRTVEKKTDGKRTISVSIKDRHGWFRWEPYRVDVETDLPGASFTDWY